MCVLMGVRGLRYCVALRAEVLWYYLVFLCHLAESSYVLQRRQEYVCVCVCVCVCCMYEDEMWDRIHACPLY